MLTTITEVQRFLRTHLDSASVTRPNPLLPETVSVEFTKDDARVSCRVTLILPCSDEDAQEAVREIERKARPLRGGA